MSNSGDTYYSCPACAWVQETKQRASQCHRCLAHPVQSITVEQMLALVEAGHVIHCKACKSLHSR